MRLLDEPAVPDLAEDFAEELSFLRLDPLLVEQELDSRPRFAAALESVLGLRAGKRFFRSDHDHLYALELGDLGRGRPATAAVHGCWERFEPRPPEHEIDADLAALSLWLAEATAPHGGGIEATDVAKVFERAGVPAGWPPGAVARTPEERFAGLPDFPFEPRYLEVEGLRCARVEAGAPESRETFLLLHGEPTWSFLYRKMIPTLARAGRVVAPDLVGFGRSDKPIGAGAYTYRSHTRWLRKLVDALDLRGVTLMCQDWGGLVGLRLVAAHPERFARVVVGNTGLPTGHGKPSEAFLAWQQFSQTTERFPVGGIINGGCTTDLAPDVIAAYDAPFPDDSYKAGARIFPTLVPTSPDDPATPDNEAAWAVLSQFEKPWLCAFSDSDPITKGTDRVFLDRVPGTKGQPHTTIEGGGHFLQEDKGPELAKVIATFIEATT